MQMEEKSPNRKNGQNILTNFKPQPQS